MTGIVLYLKHVADLIVRRYEREAMLHAHHLHSFAPLLRFEEQLAASVKELAEHRAFVIERYKTYIWPNKEANVALVAAKDEARRRVAESEQIWECELTGLGRCRMKLWIQRSEQFREKFASYKDTCADLFEEELQCFSTDLCSTEEWSGQENTAFCKTVFASQEAATELTLDRKLPTKASPTFSKVLAQNWKVSIHIDGKHLNLPFGGSSTILETGEVSHHGPWVDAGITIRPIKPSLEELRSEPCSCSIGYTRFPATTTSCAATSGNSKRRSASTSRCSS